MIYVVSLTHTTPLTIMKIKPETISETVAEKLLLKENKLNKLMLKKYNSRDADSLFSVVALLCNHKTK
jgi:hypothetical protein